MFNILFVQLIKNMNETMAHELYVLFGNARERENFFWKQVRMHELHLENQ